MEYLEFTHSDGVEMDFHFAIDVVTDLAAILLAVSYTHLVFQLRVGILSGEEWMKGAWRHESQCRRGLYGLQRCV